MGRVSFGRFRENAAAFCGRGQAGSVLRSISRVRVEALTKIYETLLAADRLPSPKGVALDILRSTEGEDASIAKLAAICEKDPAISARLLQAANSPLSGVTQTVHSVRDAAAILGTSAVQAIALAFSLLSQNREGQCEGFDYDAFWSQALAQGTAMRRAAAFATTLEPEEAYTYGLLSPIGKLGLASVFPIKYAGVVELTKGSQWADTAELETFGVTGEQLSAVMMNSWGMPRLLDLVHLEFAELAGEQEPEPVPGTRTADLANALDFGRGVAATVMAKEPTVDMLKTIGESASRLGMSPDQMFENFDQSVEEWRAAGSALKVRTRAVPPLAEIYAAFS